MDALTRFFKGRLSNHVVRVQTDGRERGKPVRPVLP